jgi:hypothetical protein
MGLALATGLGANSMATSEETLATIFAAGDDGGWWDPSDLSTLYAEEDGTGTVAVGGAVGFMRDKSGRGNHLVQANAGLRPILRLASGQYYLEFTGDGFTSPTGLSLSTGMNVFCALRPDSGEEIWNVLWGDAAGNNFIMVGQNGAGTAAYSNAGTPTHWVDGVQVGTTTTRQELYDAVLTQTARVIEARTVDMSTWDRLNLFGLGGSFHFSGRFYGALIAPDLSSTNRTTVKSYLAGKSGATVA